MLVLPSFSNQRPEQYFTNYLTSPTGALLGGSAVLRPPHAHLGPEVQVITGVASSLCHHADVPTYVALLRGVNNLGGKKVAMAALREVVASLGHADVMTYIQSGNVLFTPPPARGGTGDGADEPALAAELEQAIAAGIGVRARAVVLSREELARCVRDNPYPGQTNPKLLHAVFLPEMPRPGLASWLAGAERQVRANGSRDQAQVRGRTVYLHTPDGYPPSELRRVLAKAGGPTSARAGGTARNWATVTRLLELCGP